MTEPARAVQEQVRRAAEPVLPPAFPVPSLGQAQTHQLGRLLRAAGYGDAQELRWSQGVSALEGAPDRIQRLRRLFAQGEWLSSEAAGDALLPLEPEGLVHAGLLQSDGTSIRASFQIQVYDGFFFIVDYMPPDHPADIVLPIGPSGRHLAESTIRRQVQSALDLGCGCGIQALLISRHARHVTATDINPRALALTRLNAELNGITNIETLEGSYFEPVRGRRFDLLVANLPYVITPENRHMYRDLGWSNDLPIRRNIEELPQYLTEGGFAHMMLNWTHAAEEAWWQPIERSTHHRNVDGWLLYSHSLAPAEYTEQWLMIDSARQPQEYERAYREWLEWYRVQCIERIGFGTLTLRRRTATDNWRCSVQVHANAQEPLGPHIEHLFRNQYYLAGVGGSAELLQRRLKPHFMTVESPKRGAFVARTTRGFLIRRSIDRNTSRTISYLDGMTTLRTAIEEAVGRDARTFAKVADAVCDKIHELANLGMIEPA